jgi:hypothetical protein
MTATLHRHLVSRGMAKLDKHLRGRTQTEDAVYRFAFDGVKLDTVAE